MIRFKTDPDFRFVNTVIRRDLLDLMKSCGFSIYQDRQMAFRAIVALVREAAARERMRERTWASG